MVVTTLFSFIFFVIFLCKRRSGTLFPSQKNVPPSPWKLPIIGNLHQLGTFPHRSLQALSKLYGKLLLLHYGHMQVLVASSAQAAREIMKNQDVIFSSRPHSSFADKLVYGGRDIAVGPYGEQWKQAKSMRASHFLSNKRVQSYRRVREEATLAMVEKIKQLGLSASVVNLSDVLGSLTNNVVYSVAFGRKWEEDENFNTLLGELMVVLGATTRYGDYIPYLGWIIDRVNGLEARVERLAKEFDEFLENAIQECRDGTIRHGDGELGGMLEFQIRDAQSGSSPVEDDTIKGIIMDLFAGGTHTTSGTMEWAMAELIKNPRAMKILHSQVREVAAETKKEIDEDDIQKMPYLKAVIKETLRLHSPVPLLLPRESTQDTRVMGYDIPSGTRVYINAWAIGRDPSLWENPEEFRPERFLDSNVDYKGQHFELIPFGSGRRGCPGIAFAEAVVELGLAKLVHDFNFASASDLDMSESSGITVHKKHPLLVLATPYTPQY